MTRAFRPVWTPPEQNWTAFRQELGQSLATLLRRLEKRQDALCASWREDLTALTLAAVEAGTGLAAAQRA